MTAITTASATTGLIDFPRSRYPTGWFQVAWSEDFAPGAVRALHYFGQELVMWRGDDGVLRALDAHCLHIGAHLGVRGTVDGNDVVCPWHGWHWDGAGHNTLIPYDTQPCKKNIQIRVWPVRERYGTVLLWHDRADQPPSWEPYDYEELDSGRFYQMGPDSRQVWRVRAHVQNPGENAADFAHIVYVHGAGAVPEYTDYRFEGHVWSAQLNAHYGRGKDATWMTPDGSMVVGAEFANFGIGMGHSRWYPPFIPALMFMNSTPVDDTHIDMFFSMTTDQVDGEERPTGQRRVLIDHQRRTVEQDFFTWENMKILDKPNFTPLETKLWVAYRRWAAQFYPETASDGLASYVDVVIDGGRGDI
jgi:phenylpropionate dioxygenase-like ring-hydroxylating dioxygenase large terminal subunit